jgi:hypothetical protein
MNESKMLVNQIPTLLFVLFYDQKGTSNTIHGLEMRWAKAPTTMKKPHSTTPLKSEVQTFKKKLYKKKNSPT